MYDVKQSTALTVLFFAHDANGDAVNSLTDGTWTKRISKNGGAWAAMTVTITFLENGWYSVPLSTAHTDTLGVLSLTFTNAGCKQVNMQYRVHARINDDLAPASTALSNATWTDPKAAFLDAAITSRMATYTQPTGFLAATFPTTVASTTNITGGTITTVTNLTNLPSVPANWLTGTGVDATAVTKIQAGLATPTNITAGTITTVGTVNALAANSVTASALAADAATEVATSVWSTQTGLGKTALVSLAELNAAQIIRVGQCQAGSTTQAIVLDAGASATDDFYNRTTITFATGAAAGQNRLINDYDGATKTAYLDRALLTTPPTSGDWFAIDSRGNMRSASDLRIGLAQAGGASSITLATAESALNDYYNRMFVLIESGTGEGQARLIDDYDGASRVATVARPWVVQPDNTSRYVILPFGSVKVSDIDADAVNASALAADAVTEIADALLKRDLSAITGESARSMLNALRKLMNRIVNNGTTLTVYKEDDTTTAYTQTVTENASRNPIQELDTN